MNHGLFGSTNPKVSGSSKASQLQPFYTKLRHVKTYYERLKLSLSNKRNVPD
uniref:Uncharacterized protein n=1 Tax=Utricularia reniformis TaxID=192314 RepID=A0A1Y0B370_9LAMI|nr:hypothetical protein AEK19_MT1706 [Utricularia reniformis]ART31886.1 hypothetical protein AEK19_MT1706 [Utricularia reniformis]